MSHFKNIGYVVATTALNTPTRGSGKLLPLLVARRKIPAQAFLLKEYFCGVDVSKTSDKKDTSASLWYSEELAVKNSPAAAIPEPNHFCE
jgi:hypothetical protein